MGGLEGLRDYFRALPALLVLSLIGVVALLVGVCWLVGWLFQHLRFV
jgi:hypothetical protein